MTPPSERPSVDTGAGRLSRIVPVGARRLPRTSSTMRENASCRPATGSAMRDPLAPQLAAVPRLTMRFPVTAYVASLAMVRVRRLAPPGTHRAAARGWLHQRRWGVGGASCSGLSRCADLASSSSTVAWLARPHQDPRHRGGGDVAAAPADANHASDAHQCAAGNRIVSGGTARPGRSVSHCVRGLEAIDAVARVVELVRGTGCGSHVAPNTFADEMRMRLSTAVYFLRRNRARRGLLSEERKDSPCVFLCVLCDLCG